MSDREAPPEWAVEKAQVALGPGSYTPAQLYAVARYIVAVDLEAREECLSIVNQNRSAWRDAADAIRETLR